MLQYLHPLAESVSPRCFLQLSENQRNSLGDRREKGRERGRERGRGWRKGGREGGREGEREGGRNLIIKSEGASILLGYTCSLAGTWLPEQLQQAPNIKVL